MDIPPIIPVIICLVHQGYSDAKIGVKLGINRQHVYRYRHQYNIAPGRNYKKHKPRKPIKRPKFKPLDKLRVDELTGLGSNCYSI